MRILVGLIRWLAEQFEAEADPFEYQRPQGHTLTLTVGPDALEHHWRCYEPESAPCREGREEPEGCLYIECVKESHLPWYALTLDGVPEEFPPLQVAFIDAGGGEFHWYDPSVGS